MAAEYEVNIKINSQQIERELKNIDTVVSRIGKSRGGGSRKKTGIAGLLPSSEDLKAAEKGIVQLTAKTKAIQGIQDKFSERRTRALIRSNALNEKELRINRQLTAEARARLRLLSQAGAKSFEASRPQGRQLADDINARAKAQDKRAKLANKINEIEARGLNVAKLRKQLGKATTEQAAGRFASAQREFRLLKKTIDLESSKLKILKEQTTQRRFAASPIRGTATMMGSPAQIAASGRQLASPIRGGIGFPGSPKALEEADKAVAALQTAGMNLMRLAGTAGRLAGKTARVIDSSNLRQRNAATLPSSEMLQARARKTGQDIVQLKTKEAGLQERIAQALERSAQRSADVRRETERTVTALTGARAAIPFDDTFGPQLPSRTSAPLTGLIGGRGGKKFGEFNNKRVGDIALGAGFPLLFGGGPGAVIGGALGGAAGGGLAAQIGLSAIGQQIDTFIARISVVGSAFNELTLDINTVATATGIANTQIQSQLEKIQQYGSAAQAAQLATELLASRVGGKGRDALQKFGEDAVKLGNNLNIIFTQLLSNIAKIAGPLLDRLAKFAGDLSARGAFKRAEGLTGVEAVVQDFVQSKQRITDVRKLRKDLLAAGFAGDLPAESTLSAKKFAQNFATQSGRKILETPELEIENIAAGIQTPDQKSAANEEQRLQKRLGKLEEERKKVLEISRFRDKIAAAEAAEDDELVIRLQGEQQIAEIEASRLKALVGVADQRERDAINIGKATEKLAAHRATERELGELQRQRQEKFEDTIEGLEHQLKLARATSEEERERLRIEKELQELREGGMSESQLGQVGDLMRQISAENSPLNQFIKQSVESLNNLEQHAVQVSQGIGNAIGNSLVSGLQNLITGAESVKEVFANMLKSIADVLAQQAAQMIGTYIAIGIARAFAGMGTGGGGETTPPTTMPGASVQTGGGLNINGIDQGIAPPTVAAAGGYFGSPTRALIGEGGEPEYVIPESKMRESMARYSRGARGSSVIPDAGASGTSGEGGGVAVAAPIDVRYTVERINSVDYVTADQFQRGLQSAADQGAKKGEQQTLKRLQLSGSTRKRIGL